MIPIEIYTKDITLKGMIPIYSGFKFTEKLNDVGHWSFKCPYSKETQELLTSYPGSDASIKNNATVEAFMKVGDEIYGKIDTWSVDYDKRQISVSGSTIEKLLTWRIFLGGVGGSQSVYYGSNTTLNFSDEDDIRGMFQFAWGNNTSGEPYTFGYYDRINYPMFPNIEPTTATTTAVNCNGKNVLESMQEGCARLQQRFKCFFDTINRRIYVRRTFLPNIYKGTVTNDTHHLKNVVLTLTDTEQVNGYMYYIEPGVDYFRRGTTYFSSGLNFINDYQFANAPERGYYFRPMVGKKSVPNGIYVVEESDKTKVIDYARIGGNLGTGNGFLDDELVATRKYPSIKYSCVAEITDAHVGDVYRVIDSRVDMDKRKRVVEIEYVIANDTIRKICTLEEDVATVSTTASNLIWVKHDTNIYRTNIANNFYSVRITPFNCTEEVVWECTVPGARIYNDPNCYSGYQAIVDCSDSAAGATGYVRARCQYAQWVVSQAVTVY